MIPSKTHQNSKKNDSGETSEEKYVRLHCLPKYALILPNGDIVDKFRTKYVAEQEKKHLRGLYNEELKVIRIHEPCTKMTILHKN